MGKLLSVTDHPQPLSPLRRALATAAGAASAGFLLLTSAYALLAYLPYTHYALIKAPPYEWLAFFAAHHAWLYWGTAAAMFASFFSRRNLAFWAWTAAAVLAGIFFQLQPLSQIANDGSALAAAFVALLPLWGLAP